VTKKICPGVFGYCASFIKLLVDQNTINTSNFHGGFLFAYRRHIFFDAASRPFKVRLTVFGSVILVLIA
jgi:hypothetical protein